MRRLLALLFVVVFGLAAAGEASAHQRRCGTQTPGVNRRQHNQQRRIFGGVRSGELTRREFFRLEREQRQIQQEKREAREDGRVTARERAELHRELNQASRHIYRAKHNRRDLN